MFNYGLFEKHMKREIAMRVTIKDVAQLSGFSTATVSFVLNNKPVNISPETKEKVFDAAKQLGYRPNRLAASLVTKVSNTLGLIIPDNSNLFFSSLSKAIEVEANNNGYMLIYGNSNNDPENDCNYIDMFVDRGVDGIILACAHTTAKDMSTYQTALKQCPIPIVNVDRVFPGTHTASIILDNYAGGLTATEYLLSLGHRKIGCVTGPSELPGSTARMQGYRDALAAHGIEFDPSFVYGGQYTIETGANALSPLLGKGVTAIFAFADMIAFGIYKEARHYNVRIPEDISVVGFDDILFSEVIDPPLTTIYQPVEEMGKKVIDCLLDILANGRPEGEVQGIFTPVLKVRGSTKRLGIV